MPLPRVDLLDSTARLISVASESHHEHELANLVEAELRALPYLETVRTGDAVIARSAFRTGKRIVIGGHLDTVPAAGNAVPTVDGDVLYGLGAADMKGGLAVMLAIAHELAVPAVDCTFVFYECEEVGREHNGLLRIFRERPELLDCDAAVLCEPTDGVVEAGCQGTMRFEVQVAGVRAHTARPWMGVNAIHRASEIVHAIASAPLREPVLDGCQYREALQCVGITGGVAGNVVPDAVSITANYRFAPDRTVDDADQFVRQVLAPHLSAHHGDAVHVRDAAGGARPGLDHPFLAGLVRASGTTPRAKLGWTDVAFFAERGIPAANLGPGDPTVAHAPDEHVHRESLERTYQALWTALHETG